jgi:hypothetical protein
VLYRSVMFRDARGEVRGERWPTVVMLEKSKCILMYLIYAIHNLKPTGHYTYRLVVTICTAQWSKYVPQSDHYMYHIVVTICTA